MILTFKKGWNICFLLVLYLFPLFLSLSFYFIICIYFYKLPQMLFGTRQDINSINKICPLINKSFLGQSLNITYRKRSGSPPSARILFAHALYCTVLFEGYRILVSISAYEKAQASKCCVYSR